MSWWLVVLLVVLLAVIVYAAVGVVLTSAMNYLAAAEGCYIPALRDVTWRDVGSFAQGVAITPLSLIVFLVFSFSDWLRKVRQVRQNRRRASNPARA